MAELMHFWAIEGAFKQVPETYTETNFSHERALTYNPHMHCVQWVIFCRGELSNPEPPGPLIVGVQGGYWTPLDVPWEDELASGPPELLLFALGLRDLALPPAPPLPLLCLGGVRSYGVRALETVVTHLLTPETLRSGCIFRGSPS